MKQTIDNLFQFNLDKS